MTSYRVEVTFLSDWQIGMGAGRHGGVDTVIARDQNGYPYLPGKSVLGVLRSAIETLVRGLDEGGRGVWHEWAEWLLGSQPSLEHDEIAPRTRALQVQPLRVPPEFRRQVRESAVQEVTEEELIGGLSTVRASTRIGADGTALPDHLRIDEQAIGGITLSGEWELPDLTDVWPVRLLLGGAARLMSDYGRGRHRGAGHASTSFGIDDLDELIDRIEAPATVVPRPPAVTPEVRSRRVDGVRVPDAFGLVWEKVVEIDVETLGPVLLGPGRRAVPGSLLLPLLTQRYAELGGLLRSGTVVVTDATPVWGSGRGERSVPWPRHLARVAVQPGNASDSTVELFPLLSARPDDKKAKPATDAWLTASHYGEVAVELRLHANIGDGSGRTGGRDGDGGVFGYEAVSAGQNFRAEVWAAGDAAGALRTALDTEVEGEARIGASRGDDYGRVCVRWQPCRTEPVDTRVPEAGSEWLVVCESDVLVRNATGRFEPTREALLTALGKALGVGVAAAAAPEGAAAPAASVGVRHTRSWQGAWGLPRPSLPSISAGSYVLVRFADQPNGARWAALLGRGLGSRVAEGFGRVALCPISVAGAAPESRVRQEADRRGTVHTPLGPLPETHGRDLLDATQQRAWTRKVRQLVAERAPELADQWLSDVGTLSQLGRLREAALEGSTTLPNGQQPRLLAATAASVWDGLVPGPLPAAIVGSPVLQQLVSRTFVVELVKARAASLTAVQTDEVPAA